jgi:hemerythrin-like domain-containing protein
MFKPAIVTLEDEHGIARKIISILDKTGQDLKSRKSLSLLNLRELVGAIEKFLEAHHKKEMEIFPYLTFSEDISVKALVEILAEEHDLGYEYIANMLKIIDHKSRDEKEKYELLPFHIEKYNQLLFRHIEKEEKDFFPLIRKNVKKDEEEKIIVAFQKIDNDAELKRAREIIDGARL